MQGPGRRGTRDAVASRTSRVEAAYDLMDYSPAASLAGLSPTPGLAALLVRRCWLRPGISTAARAERLDTDLGCLTLKPIGSKCHLGLNDQRAVVDLPRVEARSIEGEIIAKHPAIEARSQP